VWSGSAAVRGNKVLIDIEKIKAEESSPRAWQVVEIVPRIMLVGDGQD